MRRQLSTKLINLIASLHKCLIGELYDEELLCISWQSRWSPRNFWWSYIICRRSAVRAPGILAVNVCRVSTVSRLQVVVIWISWVQSIMPLFRNSWMSNSVICLFENLILHLLETVVKKSRHGETHWNILHKKIIPNMVLIVYDYHLLYDIRGVTCFVAVCDGLGFIIRIIFFVAYTYH